MPPRKFNNPQSEDSAKFETKLSASKESGFWSWLDKMHQQGFVQDGDYKFYKQNGYGYDYDLRAAYEKGLKPQISKQDGKYHWSDYGKKPSHGTFSVESKWASQGAPGRWDGDRFIPGTRPSSGGGGGLKPGNFPKYDVWPGWRPPGPDFTPLFHEGQPVKDFQKPADKLLFKLLKGLSDTRISMDESSSEGPSPPVQKPFVVGSNGYVASADDSEGDDTSGGAGTIQVWGSNG